MRVKSTEVKPKAKRGRPKKEPSPTTSAELYLAPMDLMRLDLIDQKIQNVHRARLLTERDKKDVIDKYDSQISGLVAHERQLRNDGVNLRKELGTKYGVNFFSPDVSYDDVSGRVYNFNANPSSGAESPKE